MFGYIRPDTGELKTKELALYRSVYCGICRCGGKRISVFTRFLLNYDFVFLAVVRLGVTGEKYSVKQRRCFASLKKRGVMEPNSALEFTSAAFGNLVYYKALDDISDEKGAKRFFTRLLLPLFRRMAKKSEKIYPGLGEIIKHPLSELSELEKSGCDVPDKAADCFARITASLASFGLDGTEKRVAEDIGYHIGRFVYLADAADDMEADKNKNRYNPFNFAYQNEHPDKAFIRRTLLDSGAAISRSYALCDGNDFDGIIYNVAGYGIRSAADKVINKENTK